MPTLENLQPRLNGRDTRGSEYEYLKPEHHGVDTSQFADLSLADRKRFERFFTSAELGKTLYIGYHRYPATVKFYESEDGKLQTWLMVTLEEAFHLGREPAMLGSRAVESALTAEASLEYPFNLRPKPEERWRVINAYRHQVIVPKLQATRNLFDTMRLRASNGEHVMKEDRLGLAAEVRTTVLHPLIDMVADVQGWNDDARDKMHQVLDIKLLIEGSMDERKKFWVRMVCEARDYLADVNEVFERQTRLAKQHADHPALRGVIEVVRAAEQRTQP